MKCPYCSLEISGNFSTCPKCARKVSKTSQVVQPIPPSPPQTPNSKNANPIPQQKFSVCPNPKCGLTMNGIVSKCPKCLTRITNNPVSIPTPDVNKTPENSPKPATPTLPQTNVSLKPLTWDKNKTATDNFLSEINSIYNTFENVIMRNDQINNEITTVQDKVQLQYRQKLSDIENERNKAKFEAEVKNDSSKKNTDTCLSNLNNIEQNIQLSLKNGYKRKNTYQPIEPDFTQLNKLLNQVNKPGSQVLGFLYLIPVIGFILQGVIRLLLTFYTGKLRNDLMDKIESAKVYYNFIANNAHNEYSNILSKIEKDFFNAKSEIDKKLPGFMQIIENEKNARTTAFENEFKTKGEKAFFQNFNEKYNSILDDLGGTESVWSSDYKAENNHPDEILIGKMAVMLKLPDAVSLQLLQNIPSNICTGSFLKFPFTMTMEKPINLIIDYEKSYKDKVMSGVQSIIMKLLCFMPPFTFKITYIDPIDRGTNLGLLQELSDITSFDVCKKVCATKEDIQRRLKELEIFVDNTTKTIAGFDSVYSYNAQTNNKIEYHFIIINDFPENIAGYSMDSLDVLLKNSHKCGISIIFTTSNGTSKFPAEALQNFTLINFHEKKKEIKYEDKSYLFTFDDLTNNCENFIKKIQKFYNDGIKVDNSFAKYFKISEDTSPQFDDSTKKMLIPFAVDSQENVIELELGSPLTTHAFLSGTSGSGKSTTLHILIMSIIMKYHPDDVQLWLVDYKRVEFAEYIENTPPHVKLICLEESKDFSYSLLDKIYEERLERGRLFEKTGVKDIAGYRKTGKNISRIIIIIDEFHVMTQAVQHEYEYKQKLENILSECRSFGISCFFSDQSFSKIGSGLTEKGIDQINIRLAMYNKNPQEIKDTLALDSNDYTDDLKRKMTRMVVGDVMLKRMIENTSGEVHPFTDKFKSIYIKDERKAVIEWVTKATGKPTEKPIIVDNKHRSSYDQEIINNYEQKMNLTEKQIPMHIGTPVNLNPCFYFNLNDRQRDENIMVIGANDEFRASVIYWSISSFKRQNDCKIYIFADNDDSLFSQYKNKILSLIDNNCFLTTDISEICNVISDLSEKLKPDNKKTFIVWIGLENIAQEFNDLPEKSNLNTREINHFIPIVKKDSSAVDDLLSDISTRLGGVMGSEYQPAPSPKNEPASLPVSNITQEKAGYNAGSDIKEIIESGSKFSIFTLVTYSSYKSLRDTAFVKPDYFEHKIAFKMSKEECSNFLSRSSYNSGIDNITAVYYDGNNTRTFRPYLT
ncbi:MAG: FtsK/SpoIIIE domain-containing protein [Treponema sp.]|nr:FtsK/SpoIIIE domain-containing protein [Treponema sp.]